jgi:hypothetical protein
MWKGKKLFKKTESSVVVDPNQNVSNPIPEKKTNSIFINEDIRTKLVDAVKVMAEKAKEDQIEKINKLFNDEEE